MTDSCSDSNFSSSRPLWAPWRIDYIRSAKSSGCFFCDKGGRDQLADHVVHRGSTAFVLLNEFPYSAGHVMVAPYRHVADLTELDAEERQEMMELLILAQQALTVVMKPEGFNVGFNIGDVAGAGLKEHVHGHVVPRWHGDTNFMPVLGKINVIPEALNETAKMMRKACEELIIKMRK